MSDQLKAAIAKQGSSPIQGNSKKLVEVLSSAYGVNSIEETIDVTITSPPYADQKTYEADRESQVGLDESYAEYLQNLKNIFSNVYQVTKDSGTLWIVVNSFKRNHRMVNLPGDIIDICTSVNSPEYCPECKSDGITVPVESSSDGVIQSCPNCETTFDDEGWLLQDIVIWDKKRALPYSSKGSFRNVFEYVLCFSKTEEFTFDLDNIRNPDPADLKEWWLNYPERYHPRGKLPDNIWSMVTPSQGAFSDTSVNHPAPFPPRLVERILDLTTDTGDVVLDPFAGSGTVCAQADAMNRHATGIELSDAYIDRYDKLKAEIASKWESRIENDDSLQVKQATFTKLISSLRQIRYCRELMRSLGKELNSPSNSIGINAIVHQPTNIGNPSENPQSFIGMELELLYDETVLPVPLETFQELLTTVKNKKPCNSFGIETTIKLTPTKGDAIDVPRARSISPPYEDDTWYLYLEGSHNEFASKGSPESLFKRISKIKEDEEWSFPPVISTVGVSVPHPKDVCLECNEYEFSIKWPELNQDDKQVAPIH